MTRAKKPVRSASKVETLTLGYYKVTHHPRTGKIWISHCSGEGMQCAPLKLHTLIAKIYQNEF